MKKRMLCALICALMLAAAAGTACAYAVLNTDDSEWFFDEPSRGHGEHIPEEEFFFAPPCEKREEPPEEKPKVRYYSEDEAVMMAKLLYHECRGLGDTERACVAWCVCNRVDDERFDCETVEEAITEPCQFAWDDEAPVWDDLLELADDVLSRWNAEKNGETDVGRVLPPGYCWFFGDGYHNYFTMYYGDGAYWDYSLMSPYGERTE